MAGEPKPTISNKADEKTVAAVAEALLNLNPQIPLTEAGITGTTNYGGQLRVEESPRLQGTLAWGAGDSATWGEYERIGKTDPDVASALQFVSAQIRDAQVDVEPATGDGIDQTQAETHAALLKWNILEAMSPGWPEFLEQATHSTLLYGHSVFETVFAKCNHPLLPGGTGYRISKLAQRLSNSLRHDAWVEDPTTHDLRAIRQQGLESGTGKWVNVELPADRVLLFNWGRTGGNYYGVSAIRPAYYACKIRAELLKIIAIASEREGLGIPTAYSDDKDAHITPEQYNDLFKFLAFQGAHENAAAIAPPGWKIEWVFSGGANKGHLFATYNALGMLAMRLLHAQQMTIGTGDTGSFASAKVQDGGSEAFFNGVIAMIEGVLNGVSDRLYTGLAKRFIDANFGPQLAYPKIRLTPKKTKLGAEERIRAARMGVEAGILTWRYEDENSIREPLGIGVISKEEYEAAKQEKAERAAEAAEEKANGGFQKGPPPWAKKDASEKTMKRVAGPLRFSAGTFEPRRPLRPSEAVMDLAAIDNFLAKGREDFEQGCKPLLIEALVRAKPALEAAMADGDPSDVGDVGIDTAKLEAFVRQWLSKVKAEGYKQIRNEAKKSGVQLAADDVAIRFDDKGGDSTDAPEESPHEEKRRKVLDSQAKQVTRRIKNRMASELEREAIEVLRTGGDVNEVVSGVVSRQLDAGSLKQDAGLVLTKAFNMGREEFAEKYADEIQSAELSAILDSGTCPVCERLDGEEFEFGSAEYEANLPPVRDCDGADNCRCVYVMNWKGGNGFKPVREGEE